MNRWRMAAIVEGQGEVSALPALCHRLFKELSLPGTLVIEPILRESATRLLKSGGIERFVELAARKLRGEGSLLVLLDCDDHCPAVLGPQLLARVRANHPYTPCAVVLAHREFEAWFLGAAESLRGTCRLPTTLIPHPQPESPRDCKGWLSSHMPAGKPYDPVMDQVVLVRAMDITAATQACPSFAKLVRDFGSLIRAQSFPGNRTAPH